MFYDSRTAAWKIPLALHLAAVSRPIKIQKQLFHSCKQDPQPPLSFYMALNNCKLKIKLTAD